MSSEKLGDRISIGERIKYVRKKISGTQTDFARKLGISTPYVSQLEKGQYAPSPQLILSISRAFSVRRIWLETGEGEIWGDDEIEVTSEGLELLDEIRRRMLRSDAQITEDAIAELVGIDVNAFPQDRDKVIQVSDDIELAVKMLIRIFREGDRSKIDALMGMLYFVAPKHDLEEVGFLKDRLAVDEAKSLTEFLKEYHKDAEEESQDQYRITGRLYLRVISKWRELNKNGEYNDELQALSNDYARFLELDLMYNSILQELIPLISSTPGMPEREIYSALRHFKKSDLSYTLRAALAQNIVVRIRKGNKCHLYAPGQC